MSDFRAEQPRDEVIDPSTAAASEEYQIIDAPEVDDERPVDEPVTDPEAPLVDEAPDDEAAEPEPVDLRLE